MVDRMGLVGYPFGSRHRLFANGEWEGGWKEGEGG